jgi:anaphase-promoting complex subunit 10
MAESCAVQLRALTVLDSNTDLNFRPPVKRPPITFDQENVAAVVEGISTGIYDQDEILAVTNNMVLAFPVPLEVPQDSDEESGSRVLGNDAGVGRGQEYEERLQELGAEIDGELEEEIIDQDLPEGIEEEQDDEEHVDAEEIVQVSPFDSMALGLKEINNLAHFGVSSHKPGNGVEELLSDDLDKYWQ